MQNYTVRKYIPADYPQWNDFIGQAGNATFLFHRDFMEYHQHRFEDYSLIIEDEKSWVAVLPANRMGDVIHSHQGLTYGGLVFNKDLGGNTVIILFASLLDYLKRNHFKTFFVKPILSFYCHKMFTGIECFLIHKKAELYRKDMNLTICFKENYTVSKSKLKHFRRVAALGLEIRQDNDFRLFWSEVLEQRLLEKYNAKPIHSVDEIMYLHSKFPENIKQYNVYFEGEIIAGITLFIFKNGVKSQYGATTAVGEKMRALDFLFITLIQEYQDKMAFFDMGTVAEKNEWGYNPGLLKQKEELGCSVYAQDYYSLVL